jgi:hypothetical protein
MADKANATSIKKAIKQISEIDEAITEDLEIASRFHLDFMGGKENPDTGDWQEGAIDRVAKFGEAVFFSDKQCTVIDGIHKELVLKIKRESQNSDTPKINKYER